MLVSKSLRKLISSQHLQRRATVPFALAIMMQNNNNNNNRQLSTERNKPHIVVALGGNALLKRKEKMTIDNQRKNIDEGIKSLKGLLSENTVTIVHGNGPQVGLLSLEGAAYQKETGLEPMTLDVLDAETEGMVGYLLEQAIQQYIRPSRGMATVLSQIIVDAADPAFDNPTKFVGPVYTKEEADKVKGPLKPDGQYFRRVVPSPRPVKMIPNQLHAVKMLVDGDCIVICAGGGGIPVVQDNSTTGKAKFIGVEAVIDKDRAACMMALDLQATGLLILTDVPAVALDYNTENERWIKSVSPQKLASLMDHFPDGSMGPKVESVCEFVLKSNGRGAIGSLNEADKIMSGGAGTLVRSDMGHDFIEFY